MIRALGSVLSIFLLTSPWACDRGSQGNALTPFLAVPQGSSWTPPIKVPACECDLSIEGAVEVRLHWTGQYLNGRAVLLPKSPVSGAWLTHDPRLVVQKTSWSRGTSASNAMEPPGPQDPALQSGDVRVPLPEIPAGGRLEFEFGVRHPAWTSASRALAFAFPLLFAVTCPGHCRRPPAAWPTRLTLNRPTPPPVIAGPGLPDTPTGDMLQWEQPAPRLLLVLHAPPSAELEGADRVIVGYAEAPPEAVLPLLHPFSSLLPASTVPGLPRRLHVAIEPGQVAWGLANWRVVPEGTPAQALLSEQSSRLSAWVQAPVHAREGAVAACVLAGLDQEARSEHLKPLKAAYLRWVQRRALADPGHPPGPAPVAYWTLLFAGVMQRSAVGPTPGDCDRLLAAGGPGAAAGDPGAASGKTVVAFHEVLAALGLPPSVASSPQFVSVGVGAAVLRNDAVGVKLYNRSGISLWVPLRYKSTKGAWNHWVFLPSTGREQEVSLQHTGKPVDILIDPDHVSLVLPFGWTQEGPPEDLDVM